MKTKNQAQPNRAACDQCSIAWQTHRRYQRFVGPGANDFSGKRKLKCSGESTCSRCRDRNISCSYSTQKPRGRPRKMSVGFLGLENRELEEPRPSYTISNVHRVGSETEPSLGSWMRQVPVFPRSGAEADLHLGELSAGTYLASFHDQTRMQEDLAGNSAFLPLPSLPPTLSTHQSPPLCACLACLHQSIDAVRRLDEPQFPSSLRMLREVVESAFLVVECQICPLDSMTASQNALLVCTLVIYIAQTYNQLVTSIQDEEERCIRGDIMKTMQLGEFTSDLDLCPDTLTFETTPGEWKSIAMKALKAQIIGVSEQKLGCFAQLLKKLKERQQMWHSGHCFAYREPDHVKVGRPPCLTLIGEAEDTMKRLKLET